MEVVLIVVRPAGSKLSQKPGEVGSGSRLSAGATLTCMLLAVFLPSAYTRPVRGLKDGEPHVAPPANPGEWMMRSFIWNGWNRGRARAASSGSSTTG